MLSQGRARFRAGRLALASALLIPLAGLCAAEYHVAVSGNDAHAGTRAAPLRTIGRAADLAQPGDVVTVHAGVYRERVNPPRGGTSDAKRITYQAAPGEEVVITGAEPVKGWTRVTNDTWKATVPNALFGAFNPFADLIRGDWFNPKGRAHHTGAVYLDGEWLAEAGAKSDALAPVGSTVPTRGAYLVNVAWIKPSGGGARIAADAFAEKQGMNTAPCSEGGRCLGWIEDGNWARYEQVDFGAGSTRLALRAASVTGGGDIEVRLDKPDGPLLGTCQVADTGDWQAWRSFEALIRPTSGKLTVCLVFRANQRLPALWFAEVGKESTVIWAQFKGVDPNRHETEVNVRQTVFYPDKPGRDYITVRGFTLRDAATPWAPPTAEQVGLIGTHWSKGWVIESNDVAYSICSGISLGKHGDQYDNTSADTAVGYVKTIERAHAHAIPWDQAHIGGHLVRGNRVGHCEQAGIVGSLGCAFSVVTDNDIHDIHVRKLFTGAEMAGIKFHGAIDCDISRNRVRRTCRGLWLDWMAQGTRVSCNLFYDNDGQDLFVEVDHGPFMVDNNLFLSGTSLLDVSEGGAYAHNLIAGRIVRHPELKRDTPYHPAHATAVAGLVNIKGGDDRFYNNVFIGRGGAAGGFGLAVYDGCALPLQTGGNVYFSGAKPYAQESGAAVKSENVLQLKVVEEGMDVCVSVDTDAHAWAAPIALVTTERLGKASIPQLPYVRADDGPLRIDTDYFGKPRSLDHPSAGPFEQLGAGPIIVKVWPL